MAWVIVLLGAVITAYLPSLIAGVARHAGMHGWQFQLAVEVLQQLNRQRTVTNRGCDASSLAEKLQVDVLQLEPVLEVLTALEWVGQLVEESEQESRYILLADPDATPLEPLIQQLLLEKTTSTLPLWTQAQWAQLRLRQAL